MPLWVAIVLGIVQGLAEFLPISTVGCTIGTHAGPGAVVVAFFKQ